MVAADAEVNIKKLSKAFGYKDAIRMGQPDLLAEKGRCRSRSSIAAGAYEQRGEGRAGHSRRKNARGGGQAVFTAHV